MKEESIKLYHGAGSDTYNNVITIELTKNELTLVHALLSDEFEKLLSDKNHNALHSYKVDKWVVDTIIGIEKEIWSKMKSAQEARGVVQTFLDAEREWLKKHYEEIEGEKDA